MNNTKKPVFNADAAEEYFSDLLVYYRNTANDIFRRDNDGRHASEHIYSAEYQKYVGMQIAMREVLEYFSKYELCEWITEIPTDRIREIVEADRNGRCWVLPFAPGTTIYEADGEHGVVKHLLEDSMHFVIHSNAVADDGSTWYDYWTDEDVDNAHKTREEAEAALKGRCQNENF